MTKIQPSQGEGKSYSNAWQRPRTKGAAYILEDQAHWTPEVRAEKLAEMRAYAQSHVLPGGHFIIFRHLDGTEERLDRNP